MTAVVFACGVGIGLGFWLVSIGLGERRERAPVSGEDRRRIGVAAALGSLAGIVTGWPVGALLIGGFVWAAPGLLGGKRAAQAQIARTEAVAAWTETLRDTLAAAAGLQRAIVVTAGVAPAAIAPEVRRLAQRLREMEPMPAAMRRFADEVQDATADLVVSTLVLAYERRAGNLSALLGALATSARQEAAMARRVLADRARVRAAVSVVAVFTLGAFGLLVLFNRSFLRPYDSLTGQLVLAVDGAMFACGFMVLHRLARLPLTERVLTAKPRPLAISDGTPR